MDGIELAGQVSGLIANTNVRLERLAAYARANPTQGVDRALALVATKLDEADLWLERAATLIEVGKPL